MKKLGLLTALLLLFTVVPGLNVASAVASFPRMDAATVDGYRWTSGSTFDTYAARIAALETRAQLAPRGLPEILSSANRTARPLCHGTYLAAELNRRDSAGRTRETTRPMTGSRKG